MRTIFSILFAAIAMISFGQEVYRWEDSLNLGAVVAADTVIQPNSSYQSPPTGVGAFTWSCTVDAEDLSKNDAQFEVGGSNQPIVNSKLPAGYAQKKYFKFESFEDDDLPFTLSKTAMVDTIRNGNITDITYTQSFYGDLYYFSLPLIRLTKGTNASGDYVRWYFKFFKQ